MSDRTSIRRAYGNQNDFDSGEQHEALPLVL